MPPARGEAQNSGFVADTLCRWRILSSFYTNTYTIFALDCIKCIFLLYLTVNLWYNLFTVLSFTGRYMHNEKYQN